jgi:hypothetical protein
VIRDEVRIAIMGEDKGGGEQSKYAETTSQAHDPMLRNLRHRREPYVPTLMYLNDGNASQDSEHGIRDRAGNWSMQLDMHKAHSIDCSMPTQSKKAEARAIDSPKQADVGSCDVKSGCWEEAPEADAEKDDPVDSLRLGR